MITGYWLSQAVYVAAKLGIADLVAEEPKSIGELAERTKTDPRALYRLLRALASVEVFAEDNQQRFILTPTAGYLRSDVPASQRSLAIMMGEEHFRAWGELLYSVQTGKVAFDKVYGVGVFDYLGQHPDKAQVFDDAMTGIHGRETAPMLEAYDFSRFEVVADVGGGNGGVISAVLSRHSQLRGILYDLPHVIDRAGQNLIDAGVADRCQTMAGSFFETVPAGADAYLLRHIIHDWDDERSGVILRNCRHAIGESGKLLLIESVIPPGNEPSQGKLLDLVMMVMPGGMERTEEEYRRLLAEAGFRLSGIHHTATPVSVIEGEPA
jgi:hypothetical protein